MARLIDADWLYEKVESEYKLSKGIKHICQREFLNLITNANTIAILNERIGRCEDCASWDEEFSGGRRSLNNYVCCCVEWSNQENGIYRFTSPDDYCSRFEPRETYKDNGGMKDAVD